MNAIDPSVSLPLALSIGEPAGIGPDVLLAAFASFIEDEERPAFVAFGDPVFLASRAARLGLDGLPIQTISGPAQFQRDALNVVAIGHQLDDMPGHLDPATGAATVASITAGLDAVRAGLCAALVTAPINKANLYATGFAFPGHTEFLEDYAVRHWPNAHLAPKAVMMLAGPNLRTVPVTVHIPLGQVATSLSQDMIVEVGERTAADLCARFGIAAPRLAIAGLNPHAGEQGALGKEDDAIIAPAVAALVAKGIDASGPIPADTMFHAQAREQYDAALCMYHDQALIPVKALDFHGTVNVTLGLPFVRTSPDHGTALSLAGTGQAAPQSMIAAIKLAHKMAQA